MAVAVERYQGRRLAKHFPFPDFGDAFVGRLILPRLRPEGVVVYVEDDLLDDGVQPSAQLVWLAVAPVGASPGLARVRSHGALLYRSCPAIGQSGRGGRQGHSSEPPAEPTSVSADDAAAAIVKRTTCITAVPVVMQCGLGGPKRT